MTKINPINKELYEKVEQLFGEDDYKQAIEIGNILLEKAREVEDLVSERKALEILSYASYYTVSYISAMRYIIQFSKLLNEEDDIESIISVDFVFISIFTKQGEYKEARELLETVLEKAKKNNLHLEWAKAEGNYGYFCNNAGDYDEAIYHSKKALDICETYGYKEILPTINGNLAVSYLKTGKIEKAKHLFEEVLTVIGHSKGGLGCAEAFMHMAEIYGLEGSYEEAEKKVKASIEICRSNGYIAELAEATQILSDIYYKKEDYRSAYKTLKDYIPLMKSLLEGSKEAALINLKTQYDLNKKEIEADLLRSQNTILEEKNKKIQLQTKELERLNQVLARQNDDLHQSAIEDYLTGIYNRKYFTRRMQEEFNIAKSNGSKIACIVFDIDNFKSINDTYGHLIGDEVIKHISIVCEESLDTDSIIGRFGGDEFMILMVDADIDDAEVKANELIHNLEIEPLQTGKDFISATLSLGVSDNHFYNPKSTDDMISNADKGLYLAKELGRNQCCRMSLQKG